MRIERELFGRGRVSPVRLDVGDSVSPAVVEFGVTSEAQLGSPAAASDHGVERRDGAAVLSGVLTYLSGRYMEAVTAFGNGTPESASAYSAMEIGLVAQLLMEYSEPRYGSAALRVGDSVVWRAAWGSQPSAEARVTAITVAGQGSAKHGGADLREVPWALLADPGQERRCVVDLDNNRWAYGYQITPLAVAACSKFGQGGA